MLEVTTEIRGYLLDALHNPKIEPPPLHPPDFKPPKYPAGDPPDENRLARRIRYCNYWNTFSPMLPEHQRKAIIYRHIDRRFWGIVADRCGVDEKTASKYVDSGLAAIVERIVGVLKQKEEGSVIGSPQKIRIEP